MVSHALLWRPSGECEVCDGESCTGVLAVCWQHGRNVRCVMEDYAPMWRGAVMSVRCVMVSHAPLWRRGGECEVCDGESCTGVLAA